jgi:hypothetical protein
MMSVAAATHPTAITTTPNAGVPQQPSEAVDGSGSAVATDNATQQGKRPRSWQEFGHEARRATDTLLLLNALMFIVQWMSKDVVTFWGAKVRALFPFEPAESFSIVRLLVSKHDALREPLLLQAG